MAQLPPKVPNTTPNWPNDISHHHHQRMPSLDGLLLTPTMSNTAAAATAQAPLWVDEFLDFSSSNRGSHRRSISDSFAFLELPPMMALDEDQCQRSGPILSAPGSTKSTTINGGGSSSSAEFDRFDEEQFISMFIDDAGPTVSCSNPSSPSDHNSINDDKQAPFDQQVMQQLRSEAEEEDSLCNSDGQASLHANFDNSNDKIFDPKRIKRILANRQSAQRSRVRKLQYISELERTVNSLQAEVSVLSPRVSFLDHQRLVLNVDNSVLKQRIAALSQDKLFKDAHQDALKKEIDRLKQVYYQQNLKKMENGTSPPSKLQSPIPDAHGFTQKVAI